MSLNKKEIDETLKNALEKDINSKLKNIPNTKLSENGTNIDEMIKNVDELRKSLRVYKQKFLKKPIKDKAKNIHEKNGKEQQEKEQTTPEKEKSNTKEKKVTKTKKPSLTKIDSGENGPIYKEILYYILYDTRKNGETHSKRLTDIINKKDEINMKKTTLNTYITGHISYAKKKEWLQKRKKNGRKTIYGPGKHIDKGFKDIGYKPPQSTEEKEKTMDEEIKEIEEVMKKEAEIYRNERQ